MNHEETLRRILDTEAETIDVAPDALDRIRTRIARRRARFGAGWLPRGLAMVAFTGGTAVVAAAVVALAVLGVPRFGHPTAPTNSVAAVPPSANVPVYYVGTTGAGPRLYREYHPLLVTDESPTAKAQAAVETMLTPRSAFDPDYQSPWPSGVSVHAVTVSGDTTTVELDGLPPGFAPDPLALQQLVWTVTASIPVPDVRLSYDGHAAGTPLVRGPALDVLAPVWLIDPQQGAPVGHAVKVHVAGAVPQGLLWVRVRTTAGEVLRDQPVHLSAAAPARGDATITVTLDSGTYLVEAYVKADGTDQYVDGHRISVP